MTRVIRLFVTLTLQIPFIAGAAASLGAQVGYTPQASPYRDLRQTQEVTLYSGYFVARADPARVAPRSGPMVGAVYQWRMGGPANLTVDVARTESERQVLDPEKLGTCPAANPTAPPDTSLRCKSLGMYRWPLYTIDLGLGLNLTGARSWWNFVPQLRAGLGVISDFHTESDVGAFAFGTRFAMTWGAGIQWVPGGRYQLRADVVNHLYSVAYPTTYFQLADDATSILSPLRSRKAWLNNPALSIGLSYRFGR